MKLMTKELYNKIPALYTNEGKNPKDVKVVVKFFDPTGSWTWYATEGQQEGDDFIFFGLVRGLENELGYFSLKELKSIKGKFGLGIERDMYFGNHTLAEVMDKNL